VYFKQEHELETPVALVLGQQVLSLARPVMQLTLGLWTRLYEHTHQRYPSGHRTRECEWQQHTSEEVTSLLFELHHT
jgi:hypothetical protein